MRRILMYVVVCATGLALMMADVHPHRRARGEEQPKPPQTLPNAHAHNDYYHKRPLLDALDEGFCSVEADVFLRRGELLVAHTVFELVPSRTLEKLYLAPLRERIQANKGRVHADGSPVWLLIDIKDQAEETYTAVDALLEKYDDILSCTTDGRFEQKPVTVVISGACPAEMIRNQKRRHAGIDGRPADFDSEDPPDLLPWISTDWKSHFRWRGTGEMPAEERLQLKEFVERAHAGKRAAILGRPDQPAVWSQLREAGVDLIGADDLAGLRKLLTTRGE